MIPTEHEATVAVDAAARAWFDRGQAQRRDEGRKRPDGQPWEWEDLTPLDQNAYREVVLPLVWAALEALPDRSVTALLSAADDLPVQPLWIRSDYQAWLCARAEGGSDA